MRNSKQVQIKPMIFKNMSSNFLRYILHSMRHIEIYPVVPFSPKNRNAEKPMIRFLKIFTGEFLCTLPLLKIRCCVYPRFLPSFPSAEALGGQAAKAGAFQNQSKSAPALPRGEPPTSTRFWKRLPAKQKKKNEGNIFPRLFVRHARQSAGSVASVKGKALRAASRP